MNRDFNDRRVLVTGAAGGIGSAIVKLLLERGAAIAAVDCRVDALNCIAKSLDGFRHRFFPIVADVGESSAIGHMLESAWNSLGGVDTLVNCAAIYPSHPILMLGESDWDRVIAVNLKAPFILTQAFARRLVAAGAAGHIINITSGNAERARIGACHYCVSKAGLEMLTRTFALELAEFGIHVNSVSPGFIDVQSEVNPLSREYVEAISSTIPWPRNGRVEDVARAVAFLCSDEADWITGITLRVDGGRALAGTPLPSSGPDEPASS